MSKNILILLTWFLLFCCSANANEPSLSGVFDVDDASLYLECYGDKSPTLIVHSAFDGYGSQKQWKEVISQLNNRTRICLYDRANMGLSSKLTKPNDIDKVSLRLKTLLLKAKVAPPYIMIGHSYGSYPIKAYNHRYPEDVVGILLIDPSQYGMWADRIASWRPDKETYEESIEAERAEMFKYWQNPSLNIAFFDLKTNEDIIAQTNDFADKPFVLLWAKDGIWDPNNGDMKDTVPAVWQRTKTSYLKSIDKMHRLSTNTKIEFSKTTEHNIHMVEPESVVKQINYLIDQVGK
jgi:pimeloyl-ACP methyl ester carboxylesterase